jgi:hypothetical protein
MNRTSLIIALAACTFAIEGSPALALNTPLLGAAENFAVLGHTTVTNTGPTVIFGSAVTLANVGVYDAGGANATVGFATAGNIFVGPGSNTNGPGLVNAPAAIHMGTPLANLARNDTITAFTALSNFGTASNLTGHDLGTSGTLPIGSLVAGVYSFDTTAQLNGALVLDAQGTDGGVWIFNIGTTLTTASASSVQLINPGGNLGADVGVYWVVGTSATLGTTTAFEGNILAQTSITLNTGATIYNGRALAIDGAVTLDTNIISDICPPESSAPNNGPGFSGGLVFDSDTGTLVPIGAPLPPTSGIGVTGAGGNVVADGTGAAILNGSDFGTVFLNDVIQQVFTITNTGSAPLLLGPPTLTGDFAIIGLFPVSIGVGQSADFTLALDTTTLGSHPGTITFATDAPGGPFNFGLVGQVVLHQQEGIPEPATGLLAATGMMSLLVRNRRRRLAD